ncbi:12566_t:CDS:10 [Acaulospora morrowiae]|uniref:12566_t:CDS:1 n=1 Tax=Acaulospora morrowiae TaxID=94023 RepID=A0A9N8WEE2_9GLOM|nr:12566_t:CDS:10 [Acaulospora morrowiae]
MPVAKTNLSEDVIDDVIADARYGDLENLRVTINSLSVEYLLAKDEFGNTALHMASANGHADVVEYIIRTVGSLEENVIVINAQNESGNTPLHWGALNGHEKVVELLVTNGADAKIKNRAGRTAMYEAQQNNHDKIVEFLLSTMDTEKVNENEESEHISPANTGKCFTCLIRRSVLKRETGNISMCSTVRQCDTPVLRTSPRRIPRRRDSSRQAALTFLSNISLGTENSFPSSAQRETAASSHSIPSPYIGDPKLPPITVTENDSFDENGRPNLQRATSLPFERHPCKATSNNSLPNPEASSIVGKEHTQDFSLSGKTRSRSNSLLFLTNTSLDSKKLKSNHPSRENLSSPCKENFAEPGAREGSDVENRENQNLKVVDSPSDGYSKRRRRRSSASTLKSESSSSSANSITSPTSFDNASLFRRQSHSPPKTSDTIIANNNNVNNQSVGRKNSNNLFSSSSVSSEFDVPTYALIRMAFANILDFHCKKAPQVILSMFGYNDKKSKQEKRRGHSKGETDADSTRRRKAESFAYLLEPSNSLGPELGLTEYDPRSLDNPELSPNNSQDQKSNKHRAVLSFSGLVGSLINHNTRPSDLKRESNELFRRTHPNVDPSLTLSQIRKVKAKLLATSRHDELDLEISTIAKAYAYFEKLIFKKFVNKSNRRLIGAICLLLASKVNEPMGMSYSPLLESLHKHLDVTPKEVTEQEFSVFASLDFELYLPTSEFMPHLERIFVISGDNKQEYLGANPFYEFKQD